MKSSDKCSQMLAQLCGAHYFYPRNSITICESLRKFLFAKSFNWIVESCEGPNYHYPRNSFTIYVSLCKFLFAKSFNWKLCGTKLSLSLQLFWTFWFPCQLQKASTGDSCVWGLETTRGSVFNSMKDLKWLIWAHIYDILLVVTEPYTDSRTKL